MNFEVVVTNQDKGKTILDKTYVATSKRSILIYLADNLGEHLSPAIKIGIRESADNTPLTPYVKNAVNNYYSANDNTLEEDQVNSIVENIIHKIDELEVVCVEDVVNEHCTELLKVDTASK